MTALCKHCGVFNPRPCKDMKAAVSCKHWAMRNVVEVENPKLWIKPPPKRKSDDREDDDRD